MAGSGNINKSTPTGSESPFATGMNEPYFLAFAPVPEPSAFILLAIDGLALLAMRRASMKRTHLSPEPRQNGGGVGSGSLCARVPSAPQT
jgi:hypothetical protein